jgi:hypothetical protein
MKVWLNLSRQNFKNQCCNFFKIKGINCFIKKLEDPLMTQLYDYLINGNYANLIYIVDKCANFGFFENYVKSLPYNVKWTKLNLLRELIDNRLIDIDNSVELAKKTKRNSFTEAAPLINHMDINEASEDDSLDLDSLSGYTSLNGMESPKFGNQMEKDEVNSIERYPMKRGGHCMTIDEENMIIYVFGGWSGYNEMNDLWSYDIKNNVWKLITADIQNAPSPRSCMRMVYDCVNKRLIIYGKLGHIHDIAFDRTIYTFDITKQEWCAINIFKEKTNNTIQINLNSGPRQVYEHHMVFDPASQNLYLFGGIIVPLTDNDNGI